jgi:hypothetical protein
VLRVSHVQFLLRIPSGQDAPRRHGQAAPRTRTRPARVPIRRFHKKGSTNKFRGWERIRTLSVNRWAKVGDLDEAIRIYGGPFKGLWKSKCEQAPS